MTDPKSVPPRAHEAAVPKQGREELLTDAQRDFAQLLGRLLAQRWLEEQRDREASHADNVSHP
jgi:hypothetical protein